LAKRTFVCVQRQTKGRCEDNLNKRKVARRLNHSKEARNKGERVGTGGGRGRKREEKKKGAVNGTSRRRAPRSGREGGGKGRRGKKMRTG